MSRRSRGRPVHGWLIVDKPAGPTSSAVVAKAKWALGAAKAGHAGTLDPAATGLLALAFGEATKTVPFVADARKAYRFTVRWGAQTATDDAEGAVLATADGAADAGGDPRGAAGLHRRHPAGSAAGLGGQGRGRARLRPRPRRRDARARGRGRCTSSGWSWSRRPTATRAVLEMTCGKGGYVRSSPATSGRALGCLGHVAELRRLWSGPFTLEGAVDLAGARGRRRPALAARLLPVEAALAGVPELACPPHAAERLRNGNPVPLPAPALAEGATAWASAGGVPLAIGTWRGGALHPSRVLVLA